MDLHSIESRPGEGYLIGPREAWFAFAMTLGLMVFDYVDRQVVVSLFPYMKTDWGLSDKQLGALVSVVSVTVALGALPIALVADRASRVKSIVVMATAWSLATISCMFVRSYGQLLALRAMVGVGEAGYGAVGAALIASHFPARMRGALLAGFFASASVGSVLGVMLGGADRRALGLAGRVRRGGLPRARARAAVPESARLPHGGTDAAAHQGDTFDRRRGTCRRACPVPFAHHAVGVRRRCRTARRRVGGVVVAAELPQPRARQSPRTRRA